MNKAYLTKICRYFPFLKNVKLRYGDAEKNDELIETD